MKTKLNIKLCVALCLLFATQVYPQTIPQERVVDWSQAGFIQEIPEPSLFISVTDFGAIGDGNTNESPAIQQAIDEMEGQAGILYFPAGIYILTQPIIAHSGLVIRGMNSDETHLKFMLNSENQNPIQISASQTNEFRSVVSGYVMGSTGITICSTNDFQAGDFMEIRQENGDWDISPATWANKSVGQIVQISQIIGNEIILEDELRFDYSADLNPEIRVIETIQNVKIENLKIERLDEPDVGGGRNFYFSYAVNCQISGVESSKSQGSHIYATASSNLHFFGNYIHDAFLFDGTATRGYGVTLSMHTGEVLVENNIFKNLRHAMMVKTGANGNVFSYNYSRDPHRSEPISNYTGDISIHGHYAYANLFEGNICQNIFIDHYWGPGGPYNTFMRNRTELYGFIMTNNSELETQDQNIAGNEIANFFPYGFYALSGSNHFEYANNDGGTAIPEGTEDHSIASYYYSEKPWFVSSSYPYPAIGYPNQLSDWSSPAKDRYFEGAIKTVMIEETVGLEENYNEGNFGFDIQILTNPVENHLKLFVEHHQKLNYSVYNVAGQKLIGGQIEKGVKNYNIDVSFLRPAIYFVEFSSPDYRESYNIIKE